MPPFLKAKTAGLPRWAWLGIGAGAIGVGLYLRSRSKNEEEEEPVATTPEGLSAFNETEGAGGLAGAGVIGPTAGQVLPVQTPFLPEGVTDLFTILGELITNQGVVIEHISEQNKQPVPITGGSPPEEGGAHTPAPPAAVCSATNVQKLTKNKSEISRLQGEIGNLASEIQSLTAQIQAHPKSNQVNQWRQKRGQDQTSIAAKRTKVGALSAESAAVRKMPGCSTVAA